MRALREQIVRIADSEAAVAIVGESGSGKELAARDLHSHSQRSAHPFIAVNCGAIPEALMESEFFGHRRGAFTGAHEERSGFFSGGASRNLVSRRGGRIAAIDAGEAIARTAGAQRAQAGRSARGNG